MLGSISSAPSGLVFLHYKRITGVSAGSFSEEWLVIESFKAEEGSDGISENWNLAIFPSTWDLVHWEWDLTIAFEY